MAHRWWDITRDESYDEVWVCRYKDGRGQIQYKEFDTETAARAFQKKHATASVYKKH